jgi:hypothetical protein
MPPVQAVQGTDGTPLGTVGMEMNGARPRLGNDVEGLLRGLVMHGTSLGMPKSTASSDAIPPLGPQVPRAQGLPDCSGRAPRLRALAYRLEAGVGQHGVHMFTGHCHREVDAKDRKVCLCTSGYLRVLSSPPVFAFPAPVLR